MAELTETCPNQGILNYRKLTDFCRFGQITVDSDIFCQLSVILDDFQSIFCGLGCLDSDMFLSFQSLFPCSQCLSHMPWETCKCYVELGKMLCMSMGLTIGRSTTIREFKSQQGGCMVEWTIFLVTT